MVSDTSTIEKKPVILITGGSTGLGRAIAELFAQRGHRLYLIARDHNRLKNSADEIKFRWGNEVHFASIDLSQEGAADALIAQLHNDGVYVEILVNSAALALVGNFSKSNFEQLNTLMQINLINTTKLIHHCINDMKTRNAGGILNIASFAGLLAIPNLAIYSASKAYLISLTRTLAEEMRNTSVTISVVIPGPIETEFLGKNTSIKQQFVPMLSAKGSARVSYEGFLAGQTIITPGFLGLFYRLGIKLLPHKFLIGILSPIFNRMYPE